MIDREPRATADSTAAAAVGADGRPAPDGAAVRLTGLHKSFGHIDAVRGVDLTIVPGEVVAFLGPNGAGKSTTIDMLLGLTKPDAGTVVRVRHRPGPARSRPARSAPCCRPGRCSRTSPSAIWSQTISVLHRHPMPAGRAMELAGVADLAKQRTNKLSGGQAQRVRYALALVSDPDLLVLDEPTVGMDVEVRRAFWASMRQFTAAGPDGHVRHPLPGGGGRLRRPGGGTGRRAGSSRTAPGPRSSRRWPAGRCPRWCRAPDLDELTGLAGVHRSNRRVHG